MSGNRQDDDTAASIIKHGPRNWSDIITDSNNLWLAAVSLEDDGNYLEAINLYLKDATVRWKEGSLTRAALSCACAANCLGRTKYTEIANALFFESALLYEKNAYSALEVSLREGIWSLRRAYECYIMAGSKERAQNLVYRYESLAAKISPFFDSEESLSVLGISPARKNDTDLSQTNNASDSTDESSKKKSIAVSIELSSELAKTIDTFFEVRGSDVRFIDFYRDSIGESGDTKNTSAMMREKSD